MSANLVEIPQFPNFPPILGAHKLCVCVGLACGAEPEKLGLAAATGVGNWEPMEWSLQGAWLAKCNMRFCGHFAPCSL